MFQNSLNVYSHQNIKTGSFQNSPSQVGLVSEQPIVSTPTKRTHMVADTGDTYQIPSDRHDDVIIDSHDITGDSYDVTNM